MNTIKQLFIIIGVYCLIIIFSACSGGIMGQSGNTDVEEKVKSGELVKLNLHSKNTIVRGKDVFDTVMKRYQPVIDFYGADSDIFQKLVNTNLQLNAEKLTSPDENMFNYDTLKAWGDTEFIVEYDDGTTETLLVSEMLTISGGAGSDSEWFKKKKKIVNILTYAKMENKVREEWVNLLENTGNELTKIDFTTEEWNRVNDLISSTEALNSSTGKTVFSYAATFGKCMGYLSLAFNAAQAVGLVDLGPDQDEIRDKIINMKLDHIIKLIEGMYKHLEYIEAKLDQIELVVVSKANKQLQLDLKSIMNTMNGKIQELNNVQSLENKQAIAMDLIQQVNGFLANYIDYSMADYDNFIEYQTQYAKEAEYLPYQIKINVPHRRYYSKHTPHYDRIECTLADFVMKNPSTFLPFSYEGLEYVKKLYITRLNTNSFIETEETSLNSYNSNTVLTYLGNNNYLGKLRNEINQAYITLLDELNKTKDNINDKSDDIYNYYDILVFILTKNSSDLKLSVACSKPGPGYDIPNYWSSSNLFLMNLFHENDADQSKVTHDYPYLSSITFESNDPLEFKKYSNDVTFLDDSVIAIDAYYKAKSQKLLEFAASLAALEVQLAMYLDDEAYAEYAE